MGPNTSHERNSTKKWNTPPDVNSIQSTAECTAEKMNRILVEKAKCCRCWTGKEILKAAVIMAEIIATAAYIINRAPNKNLNNNNKLISKAPKC